MKASDFQNAHQQTHNFLVGLAKFPPLTRKRVRIKYRDLVKTWRHDRIMHIYGGLVAEAQKYKEMSKDDPMNAHVFYFGKNKDANPDDYVY